MCFKYGISIVVSYWILIRCVFVSFAAFHTNSFFLFFWQIYYLFNVWRYFSRESHESHEIKDTFCGIGEICVRVINMFLLFLCLNKDKNVKLFWHKLTITLWGENEQKGGKMRAKRNKNASDRGAESAQLEKNNFSTGKIFFSNREIKFSQLTVSGFPTGFTLEK